MKERINKILKEIRPEFEFSEIDNFFDNGMLDSFDMMILVPEIEKEFGIKIDGTDIVFENFCNFEAIEKLILKSSKK